MQTIPLSPQRRPPPPPGLQRSPPHLPSGQRSAPCPPPGRHWRSWKRKTEALWVDSGWSAKADLEMPGECRRADGLAEQPGAGPPATGRSSRGLGLLLPGGVTEDACPGLSPRPLRIMKGRQSGLSCGFHKMMHLDPQWGPGGRSVFTTRLPLGGRHASAPVR